jgi:hypothetical protein
VTNSITKKTYNPKQFATINNDFALGCCVLQNVAMQQGKPSLLYDEKLVENYVSYFLLSYEQKGPSHFITNLYFFARINAIIYIYSLFYFI